MTEMMALFTGEHYLAIVLIVILIFILKGRSILSERVHQGSFWLTIGVCALLIVQDFLEKYAQLDPGRRTLRLMTSIAGYSLRPAAVLGFLLVIWPAGRKKWFLWIPVIVNAALYYTALFSPLTFFFDEEYSFNRGPLGYTMFIVCIGYLVLILLAIHLRFRDRRAGDTLMIYSCALGCIGGMIVDVLMDELTVLPCVLISVLTFYHFLRTQDMDHDPLTRLWNRMTFYDDCRNLRGAVSAAASIDMNGLKRINDELGHDAGDRALISIGRVLGEIREKGILPYRIGGDEFMILFLQTEENHAAQIVQGIQREIWRIGLSAAVGFAAKTENESVDELIRISDQRMYENKSAYYMQHDRRRKA